jgi:hypothetical protein
VNALEPGSAASPLELLHPSAAVERMLVAGDRCPASLLPLAERAEANVGLAVIAPSAAQLARRGWLAGTLAAAAIAVAADGIVYVRLPPALRALARRRLRESGLELGTPLAQLPARSPRYLLPMQARPWRHMLDREIGAHPRVRGGLSGAVSLPSGARLLAESLPGAALVARRRHAAPLAAWLDGLEGDTRPTAHVAVVTSWRGPAGPVILFCFAEGDDRPWGVAKLAPDALREAQLLDQLGPDARAAGAGVPRVLARGVAGAHPVLVESPVTGTSAARVLAAAPERLSGVAHAVAGWLQRWSTATAQPTTVSADWLERIVLDDDLPPSYRAWLGDRCAEVAGSSLPLVAAHHDLTMWNLRLGHQGALGVLDWAEAEREALPLTDLFYAIADARAACDGYRDRVSAARAAAADPLAERLRVALELSPAAAELCLHACWLRHARNEQRAGAADRPFAEVVRWLTHRAAAS